MNKKFFGRVLSLLTATAMVIFFAPVTALGIAPPNNETVISSKEDFEEFVKICVLDSNTIGRKYSLECDIELSADFKPIPTFCGTFEGNGHTVSGLNITANGSDLGLFRYIEKEGTVKNLNVRGKTSPTGSAAECGGIAGVNRGKILGCSFNGMVSGKEYCGGIAGKNEKTGLIANCTTGGLVQARHYTGGTVGENLGVVIACENNSSVNVMAFDETMDLENINIDDIYSTENATEITDEGGIAGYSAGIIQNCVNRGNVGYIHVGYNVGGIAGRQEGYISGCENYGTINGRKDTGGIVGQAEPHISLLFSERSMSKLRTQLDELNGIIDRTINNADGSSSELSENWDEICGELETARQISDEFLDMTDVIINSDVEAVNELSSRISDFIDMAAPAAESLENASGSMSEGFGNLKNSVQLISEAMETADEGTKILFPILQDLSNAVESFKQASASLDSSFGELQSSVGDEQQMESALSGLGSSLQLISAAAGNLSGTASRLAETLNGAVNDPYINTQKQEIQNQLNRLSTAADRLAQRIRNSSLSWGMGGFDETSIGYYLQEIGDILSDGSMADLFESLSAITEAAANIMSSEAAKALDEQLKAVSAELGIDFKQLESAGYGLSSSVGEISEQVNASGLFGFIRYLREANQDLNGATASADSVIERITSSWDYFDRASAMLVAAVWFAEDATVNARTSADQIKDAFSQTVDILEYFSGKEKIEFVGADDGIIAVRNRLSISLENLLSLGEDFGDSTGGAMSTLAENFRQINSKASEISDTILDIVDEVNETSADIEDYTDDISAEDAAGQSDGKVERCENYGGVYGDLCAGGIAGSMAVEYDFDPEGDIERIGTRSASFIYQSKTVVRDSTNYGEVVSKKGRAGGIAGEMSTGCLIGCNGFGDVSSTDGDCTGGIAGKSEAAIHSCTAKCRVSGIDFVGGIAGTAHDMRDCKSFVVIESGTERVGAVAGYSDFTGEIKNNVFVDGGIGAVDGISYGSIAYPVPYETMISLEDTPKEFNAIELTFIAEGETVKTLSVSYGESLAPEEIPDVPLVDGCFGRWEDFGYENITFGAEINAVYEKFVTALETAEKRENGLPIAVAEGSFTDGDSLDLTADGEEIWSITIPEDGADVHRVRFLPLVKPSKAVVTVTENGVQRTAETEIDGKYLVLEISGNTAVIAVTEKDSTALIIALAAALAAVVIILLIIIIRKNRKKPPKIREKKSGKKVTA